MLNGAFFHEMGTGPAPAAQQPTRRGRKKAVLVERGDLAA
jgi:hypothetical protein